MNRYSILEYTFACFYVFALSAISFAVGAGIMWLFPTGLAEDENGYLLPWTEKK